MLLAAREVLPMNALLLLSALAIAEPAAHEHHDHSDKIGQVVFESTCSPQAHSILLRGMAWLHSFEYQRAESTFSEAAAADPGCAMAHWGVAMSNYHPLWAPPTPVELEKGRAAVAKAEARPAKSERERAYVAAIAAFYRDSGKLDHKTRALAYNAAMADLHKSYSADREAAVFYALSQIAAGTLDNDPAFAREKDAAAILNTVLEAEPDHPGVAHYLIHSFDYPALAELAVPAARRYATIAPASAHAQHMPSHIFTRLGMWEDSIKSNLAAESAARAFAKSSGMAGAWDQQLHAMDYLTYAFLQTGRDSDAGKVLQELESLEQADPPSPTTAYAATAIPARVLLERRMWKEAAAFELPANVAALKALENHKWAGANIAFAQAVGAARSGDVARARQAIGRLSALEQSLQTAPGDYDWRKQVSIERQIAEAWLAQAEGKKEEAVAAMRAAADLDDATEKHPVTPGAILPAREQLGELLLEQGRSAEALAAYEASLKRAPRRLAGLYGAARAAQLAGDAAKAKAHYAELVDVTKASDGTRAEVKEARSQAAEVAQK
jgi:tetratricopeptide (TPR) repeat protein